MIVQEYIAIYYPIEQTRQDHHRQKQEEYHHQIGENPFEFDYENLKKNTEFYLKVTAIDRAGNQADSNEILSATTPLAEVGDYVAYTPDQGEYSSIAGNAKYTGNTSNGIFTTDSFSWRIWDTGEETGKLILIADGVTSQQLYLTGALGYNNGVGIMNDICNSCYSNSTLGATSRNLNIEDIEAVLNISYWNPRTYSENGYKTYTDSYKSETYRYYPYIWQYEEYANIGGVSTEDSRTIQIGEGEGISRSTQPRNEEDEYGYWTQTYNTATIYTQPMQTKWKQLMSKEVFIDSNYSSIVQKIADNTMLPTYFLSSRCLSLANSRRADHNINGVRYAQEGGSWTLQIVSSGDVTTDPQGWVHCGSATERNNRCYWTDSYLKSSPNTCTRYILGLLEGGGAQVRASSSLRPIVMLDLQTCKLLLSGSGTSGNPYTLTVK